MNETLAVVQPPRAEPPKTSRGRKTWSKLLEAAASEFGTRGFHDAAINRITEAAGVAMGTFYVHFQSKEQIYRELVSHMGEVTRRWISERISDEPNRLAAERRGIEVFIDFVREHQDLYRIVNEAQFVAPDAYREYYCEFAKAYEGQLSKAACRGDISDGDHEKRAWALIGASVFLGIRFGMWDQETPAREVAAAIGDFFEHGLKADRPSEQTR